MARRTRRNHTGSVHGQGGVGSIEGREDAVGVGTGRTSSSRAALRIALVSLRSFFLRRSTSRATVGGGISRTLWLIAVNCRPQWWADARASIAISVGASDPMTRKTEERAFARSSR